MSYRIWFEREILPSLRPLVPPSVVVLGPGTDADTAAGIETAEAALAARIDYGDRLFARAPRLLGVFRTGIGYDSVDLDSATRHGVAACNVPDGPTVSTAEHSVALILTTAKGVMPSSSRLRAGSGGYFSAHQAVELDGKVLGLVGYGRIARRVGTTCRALGMGVLAYDPYLADADFPTEVDRSRSLLDLCARSDVISVHVPMTADNAQMFNAKTFAATKPGTIFVNAARGGVVDHDALLEALDSGHLFGAGLDVTDPEPLPPDHPLLHHPRAVVTPHIASSTPEARQRMFCTALDQAMMVLDGEKPPHLLNPASWPGVQARLAGRS